MSINVGHKLTEIIEALGLNPKQFAESLDFAPTKIYEITGKKQRQPTLPLFIKIAEVYPQVNPKYLLVENEPIFLEGLVGIETDANSANSPKFHKVNNDVNIVVNKTKSTLLPLTNNQPVMKAEQGQNQMYTFQSQVIPVVISPEGEGLITVLDIEAAAGLPTLLDQPEYYSDKPVIHWPGQRYRNGQYYMIQVAGDSMSPTVYDHDFVICRLIQDASEIRDNYIHIVVTRSGVVCKRVLNRLKDRQSLALKSDNRNYTTYDEPITNVLAIYRVEEKISANLADINLDMRKEVDNVRASVEWLVGELAKKNILDSKPPLLVD